MELKLQQRNGMQMGTYGFELNLYGIEIAAAERHADGHVWFELNLYGIEIGDTNGIADGQSV